MIEKRRASRPCLWRKHYMIRHAIHFVATLAMAGVAFANSAPVMTVTPSGVEHIFTTLANNQLKHSYYSEQDHCWYQPIIGTPDSASFAVALGSAGEHHLAVQLTDGSIVYYFSADGMQYSKQ